MLHWLYPRYCELCFAPCEQDLCDACLRKLSRVPLPICLYCGASVAGDQGDPYRCRECQARPRSFDFARSALLSDATSLRLVYRLKYHHANYLAPALSTLLCELWDDTPAFADYAQASIVPVPAERGRLFRRGFNQAEELARALGKLRHLPVISPLVRLQTGVDSQTLLNAAERRRNAQRAYSLSESWLRGRKSAPSHLVLIDDVFTTGSTVRACAHALKKLPGVRHVAVLTLVRASRR